MNNGTSQNLRINILDENRFISCRRILLLSGPLILSQMGVMIMQIVDGIFLAHYSETALAAIGPAGMSFFGLSPVCSSAWSAIPARL